MTSWSLGSGFSGDRVFLSMIMALPAPLSDAIVKRGLAGPGLLACYPRTDYRQLGLLPVVIGVGASSSSSISPSITPSLMSGTHGLQFSTDAMINAHISTPGGEVTVVARVSQFSQIPLGPDATSPTSAHTGQYISRGSNVSTSSAPSRTARKKASHAPPLTHTGSVACVSSLETVHEDLAVSESLLRFWIGQGIASESHECKCGEVPMGPSHEDATVTVQSSWMDVGISNLRVANVLISAGHETSDGVITTSPLE